MNSWYKKRTKKTKRANKKHWKKGRKKTKEKRKNQSKNEEFQRKKKENNGNLKQSAVMVEIPMQQPSVEKERTNKNKILKKGTKNIKMVNWLLRKGGEK